MGPARQWVDPVSPEIYKISSASDERFSSLSVLCATNVIIAFWKKDACTLHSKPKAKARSQRSCVNKISKQAVLFFQKKGKFALLDE